MANVGNIIASGYIRSLGEIIATKFVKQGGTSTQFLKADGSVDTNTYLTTGSASNTYLSKTAAEAGYQPLDADLTSIAGLTGTSGLLKKTAANTWGLDTNTYLTTTAASTTYQPLDADLTSIAGLSGTIGLLKKTAANTWGLDTTSYAPLASPALTGTPTAPTAGAGTNTTQIATTAFVKTAIDNLVNGAGGAYDTLKELQTAIESNKTLLEAIPKNTTGSTNSDSKLYLVGATEQSANPTTYSDSEVYTTNGTLTAAKLQVGGGSATIEYDTSNKCIRFKM